MTVFLVLKAVLCEDYLTLTRIDDRFFILWHVPVFPPWLLVSAKPPGCSGIVNFIACHYSQFGFYSSVRGTAVMV